MNKTIYLTLQSTIRQALSMVLFMVLARYLSVEDFGKYQQLLLVVGIFGIVFSMGIPVAISYFHGQSNNYQKKVSVYKRFFITQILLVFIGALIFYSSNSLLSSLFKNEYFETFTVIVCIIMITNTSLELFKNLSTVTNNLKFFLVSTSLIQIIGIFISLCIVLYTKNIFYILLTTAIFNSVTFFILVRKNLKYFLINTKRFLVNSVESKYILSMGSVALIQVFNGYMDQIMVSLMLSIEDYSNLKIGAFQIPFIGIVTGSLLTVMIPIISKYFKENNYSGIVDTWRLSIEKASILLIPIIIFCLIFANKIIILFFGSNYEPAVIIFQAYMIQWLRAVVIFGGIMGAIGLEKELFKNTIFVTILNVILNYILILKFGVLGAAIATTSLNYIGAYLLIRKIDDRLEFKFFKYFPYKVYFISLVLSLIVGFILFFLFEEYLNSFVSIIFMAMVFYIIIILIQLKIFYNEITYKKLRELL